MAEVVVVATMKAGEGNVETVLEAITQVAGETHAEEGCITCACARTRSGAARCSRPDVDPEAVVVMVTAALGGMAAG